ncbi:alpha/beta fold hydrolase [Paenibacillus frigoriresistens]|uniref:alpha/beta fold hydrolase n=1 Tax=Paenibacillus alginolyticus TaxID=59839 RepID=UPI001566C33B|nr:alpha/beta hydrolase [Paenibacillus frigoriresistens]NRF94380.1 alpha/beta fold hydrolase [Paenibacillus frigoriresistens]
MDTVWTNLNNSSFKHHFVDANGIKTRCLEVGSGEPLILLHGTGGHLEAYSRNIVEHAKHFHVYAIDMIGHGFTDKPFDKDYDIPVYTKHLKDFMDAVGIDSASISGESLGGWVAAWFAWEYPEKINKIILNTSGGLSMYPEVMERIRTLTMAAVQNPTREVVRKRLEFLMLNPEDVTEELVEIRRTIYLQPNFDKVMERVLCLQIPEIRKRNMFTEDQLRAIKAPTCIIWTTHDPTAPKEIGQKFADLIPNSEFHVMEDCAHWPQYEQAEIFNKIHLDFLKNQY